MSTYALHSKTPPPLEVPRLDGLDQCGYNLGWEFQFLVLIYGNPIGSGIPIPFSIVEILVGIVFFNSLVWKVRKAGFRFAKFRIPVICLRRNSLRLIVDNLY